MLLYYSFPIYLEFDLTDVLCIAFVRTLKLQKLLVCFHSRRSLELFDVCLCVSACGDRMCLPISMNMEEYVRVVRLAGRRFVGMCYFAHTSHGCLCFFSNMTLRKRYR